MPDFSPSLPVISLRRLTEGPERAAELRRLREVTHTIGFFYLSEHDVPVELQEELFKTAKKFFAQPREVKERISNIHSPQYRGYAALGDERTQGTVDWREQIDYGPERETSTVDLDTHPWRILEGPNPWPDTLPELRPQVTEWMERLTDVSLVLLRGWAESLGQPADFFDPYFTRPFPLLKLCHYPPAGADVPGLGVGAHHDSGVLTLLLPEAGSSGLQVRHGEEWLDVDTLPNHFVVNIGELLEGATDGYLRATPHRVLPTRPGETRYSLPYFLTPDLDARLPKVPLPEHLAGAARGTGQDLSGQEIFEVSGLNALKSRLRAHPAITHRFHSELAASWS
ncbi:MAG TPA: 2-oxoglutarate and iron-dependent oxygenase domain-containing protein [Corynebacterium sp.]|nr:2-oxoglutarate and iron-dependent oxygenase domain-containing protein [Corynebacterium sp.]